MQALHEMMTFLVSMENRISSLQAFFFFNDTATTEIYTLSLHDALPICRCLREFRTPFALAGSRVRLAHGAVRDRKSTRLNSSHLVISYAVFCLKKKNKILVTLHDALTSLLTTQSSLRSLHTLLVSSSGR